MKELSTEEKAKRYDEAIEIFDVILNLDIVKESGTIFAEDVRKIFPELKESEGEKIRKNLIGYIKGISKNEVCEETKDSWIAWLEKQGDANKEYWRGYREGKQEILDKYAELEKQGEQKPTNEPKYKVGDIIRRKEGDGLEWTVEEVFNNGYYTIVCANRDDFILLDDNWELVEQKPDDKIEPKFNVGDKIQYLKGCGTIMTIEKIENGEYIFANNLGHTTIEDGNKWYLVECNHTWSEEDENAMWLLKDIVRHSNEINEKIYTMPLKEKLYDWLKSLKDRVQPKQEWNKEDEDILNTIINHFEIDLECTENDDIIRWLKSLKPQSQWKPSDEQIKALANALSLAKNCGEESAFDLRTLYEQLKKLKEE